MTQNETEISVKGRKLRVPSMRAADFEIVVTGNWLRVAAVNAEDYETRNPAEDPEKLLADLQQQGIRADIFTFAQRVPDVTPRFQYPLHWDNVAALPMLGYSEWWDKRLSPDTRRNVRLAAKRGLVVRPVEFDDHFVEGIRGIYNETPLRQGRKFWHYGKDFETVKRENGTYSGISEFIGAYLDNELVGFLKMVYVGKLASIMQILSKTKHYDKRPMNALMAKAVEVANEKGMSHLLYRKWVYHKNLPDALTEFKRRNGFEQVLVPRYYVPLTTKGRTAISLNLHLGFSEILPRSVVSTFLKTRNRYFKWRFSEPAAPAASGADTGSSNS